MARGAWAVLLASTLLAAGCIGTPDEDGPDPDAEIADIGDAGALASPPTWAVGDWWRVEVTSDLTGGTVEATIVVAAIEDGDYLVGMPVDDFAQMPFILHMPGIGPVRTDTFAYEVHDDVFQPLAFPLAPGTTWSTTWIGQALDAEVVSADETAAEVEFVGENTHMTLTYEQRWHHVTDWVIDGYGTMAVLDHGHDYEGVVKVPDDHDLVFLHGRVGPALDTTLGPAAPAETVTVDGNYTETTFMLLAGDILAPEGTGGGTYRETATAPDGETFQVTRTSAEGPGVTAEFFTHDAAVGDWELEHVSAGPGAAFMEGLAYTAREFDLGGA